MILNLSHLDPQTANLNNLNNLNFHPLELKVGENYSYLVNLRPKFANLDV